jgi:hypothetical protein
MHCRFVYDCIIIHAHKNFTNFLYEKFTNAVFSIKKITFNKPLLYQYKKKNKILQSK